MTDTSSAATRMCLICGIRVPATHLRLEPGPGCTSPDACTFDLTTDEAWQYWRQKYHDVRIERDAAIARAERAERERDTYRDGLIHEWKVGVAAAATITALRQREAEAVAGAKAEGMREAAELALGEAPLAEETIQNLGAAQFMNNLLTVSMSRAFHAAAASILAAADKLEGK